MGGQLPEKWKCKFPHNFDAFRIVYWRKLNWKPIVLTLHGDFSRCSSSTIGCLILAPQAGFNKVKIYSISLINRAHLIQYSFTRWWMSCDLLNSKLALKWLPINYKSRCFDNIKKKQQQQKCCNVAQHRHASHVHTGSMIDGATYHKSQPSADDHVSYELGWRCAGAGGIPHKVLHSEFNANFIQ